MASKRQKKAGWKLPPVIEGHDVVCYCVPIPNTREYRAAFMGALKSMGQWWNWEKSYTPGDTRATRAAMLFRELHRDVDMVSCNSFDLRQNPVNPCQIQKSLDGGLTWEIAWDSSLCEPANLTYRYNPVTGIYESSANGGQTWEDATATDGRFTSPTTSLPNVGDLRCKSAENVTDFLQKTIAEFAALIENGGTMIAFMGVIIAIFASILSVGIALPLAITLITTVLTLTTEQMSSLFNAQFWLDMTCFIYCRGREDGKYTFANWQALSSEVEAEFPTSAGVIIKYLFWLMGTSGLTNAGASGQGEGLSCGDCDCGLPWQFVWFDQTTQAPLTAGNCFQSANKRYQSSKTCGWNSSVSTATLSVNVTFPTPVNVTRATFNMQNQCALPVNPRGQYIQVYPADGSAPFYAATRFEAGSGSWVLDTNNINLMLSQIRFITQVRIGTASGDNNNFSRITRWSIDGTGDNPFT